MTHIHCSPVEPISVMHHGFSPAPRAPGVRWPSTTSPLVPKTGSASEAPLSLANKTLGLEYFCPSTCIFSLFYHPSNMPHLLTVWALLFLLLSPKPLCLNSTYTSSRKPSFRDVTPSLYYTISIPYLLLDFPSSVLQRVLPCLAGDPFLRSHPSFQDGKAYKWKLRSCSLHLWFMTGEREVKYVNQDMIKGEEENPENSHLPRKISLIAISQR